MQTQKANSKIVGQLEFNRCIAIRHDVDVFVAGGGPAGLAAAVMAARQGARVFLAEGTPSDIKQNPAVISAYLGKRA